MQQEGKNDFRIDGLSVDLSREPQKIKDGSSFGHYLRIFSYADSKDWVLNVIAVICSIIAGMAFPIMTITFGYFINIFNEYAMGKVSAGVFQSSINSYALYLIYLFIVKATMTYAYTLAITISATRTTKALRIDLLERTLRQEIGFFDTADTGSVSVRIMTNANQVNNGIGEKLGITISAITTFVSAFVVAIVVQWKLALITLGILLLLLIVVVVTVRVDQKRETRILAHYSEAYSLAEDVITSIETVHAFWAYDRLSKRFNEILKAAEEEGMKKSPNLGVMYGIEYFCIYAGYALAFWQGFKMYSSGQIDNPGKILTVELAIIIASSSINFIAPQVPIISKASLAASELFRIIDRPSQIDPLSKEGFQPVNITGNIEFSNVVFAYPSRPSSTVLEGLTLSIPANKKTALVGASGCGKSTIVGLLERWYDFSAGSIRFDGVKLRSLNLSWLRSNIRLVEQTPILFKGTVFQNVVNGLEGTELSNIPEELLMGLVEEACKLANAHGFVIELPNGYNSEIGERGHMLSGGQKQRIAIARAIISDPKVLLLDEATSALDPQSERLVQIALDRASQDRTTIVISHKLATVMNADNIAVIANGVVAEQGTHEELLAARGIYSLMAASQYLSQVGGGVDLIPIPKPLEYDSASIDIEDVTSRQDNKKVHEEAETMNYSLAKCLYIMIMEQKGLWPWFFILFLACILAGLTFLVQAILFARSLEVFQLNGEYQMRPGNLESLRFFMLALFTLLIYFVIGWASNVVEQVTTRTYRFELFDKMIRQDIDFFNQSTSTVGALTSHLSTKPTALQELFGFNLFVISAAIMTITGSCILALITGWKLGIVLISGAMPPLVLSGYMRTRIEAKLESYVSDRFSQSAGLAGEAVASIRTVSSLALERYVVERYQESLSSIVRRSLTTSLWIAPLFALSQSIEILTMALGFWYGGHLVSSGEYSTYQLYLIFATIIFTGQAAAQFLSYTSSITKATSSANYILWLRNRKRTIEETALNSTNGPSKHVSIGLEKLRFSYTPDSPEVIKGISMKIPPGQFVAFVGPSGCGKSTVIALLERFHHPGSGKIKISDVDLSDLSPRLYRRSVGVVQQQSFLYQGSIRENIALGLEEPATDEQILEACAQANILTFIQSLPEGLSTPCGAQGLQLSGGQRQRISLARALIRKPSLLLLDEATSALDRESEKAIQVALEAAREHTTTIAMTHRLSTIKDADTIYVLSHGRIAEAGTHSSLLAERGMYYEMCLSQLLY